MLGGNKTYQSLKWSFSICVFAVISVGIGRLHRPVILWKEHDRAGPTDLEYHCHSSLRISTFYVSKQLGRQRTGRVGETDLCPLGGLIFPL